MIKFIYEGAVHLTFDSEDDDVTVRDRLDLLLLAHELQEHTVALAQISPLEGNLEKLDECRAATAIACFLDNGATKEGAAWDLARRLLYYINDQLECTPTVLTKILRQWSSNNLPSSILPSLPAPSSSAVALSTSSSSTSSSLQQRRPRPLDVDDDDDDDQVEASNPKRARTEQSAS